MCVIVAAVMKVPWGAGAETSLYTATPYNLEFSLEISTQIMPHPWLRHRNAFQGKPVLNKSGGEVWLCSYWCFGFVLKLCVCTHMCMIVGVYVHARTQACTYMHHGILGILDYHLARSFKTDSGVRASIFFLYFQSFSLSFFPALLQLQ